VAIWTLSVAFVRTPAPPKERTVLLPPIPDVLRREPPPPQQPLNKPRLDDVLVDRIPVPNDDYLPRQTAAEPARMDDGAPTGIALIGGGTAEPLVPPQPERKAATVAGPVCVEMPRPEAPAVNWAGNAVLQAVATVQGGRMVGTEIRVVQGSMDARTRRALTHAVEAALAGYRCPGDQRFQQEFSFRIE
jgi:hypothetical protein